MVSSLEREVYKRQIMMPGWSEETQDRLKNSTVLVAGAGGLGSPVAMYLAVAGVGTIRICDFDSPDWSNLNRQILHDPSRIGVNKARSARKTLERLNGLIRIIDIAEKITGDSVDRVVDNADLIVDCMDNMETRFVLDDCARRRRIPLIHGAVRGLEGRMTFIQSPETPCLRCLTPEAPPKEIFPIVGAVPGVIGSLQALEAIKFLTGTGALLRGKWLVWDGEFQEFHTFPIPRDPSCPACAPVSISR